MTEYMKTYAAVTVQSDLVLDASKDPREVIGLNLGRAIRSTDYVARQFAFGPIWAPVKLLVFSEFFLSGWIFVGKDQAKWDRSMAIKIPGKETDMLGQKAVEHGIFIAGCSLEIDSAWPNHVFNCGFIIGPNGNVILKYRKITPSLSWETAVSPHDIYDSYIEHSQYGADLRTFFPVVDTTIGKLGYFICRDGNYPENARALAINGAEVLIRSSGNVAPFGHPPIDAWTISNRFHAMANLVYVVAASHGKTVGSDQPEFRCPGKSMIVDFNGAVLAMADYPGDTITGAVINLETLRRRRMDPTRNYLAEVRSEVYKEIYKKPIYPPNTALKKGFSNVNERNALINNLVNMGIYTRPDEK